MPERRYLMGHFVRRFLIEEMEGGPQPQPQHTEELPRHHPPAVPIRGRTSWRRARPGDGRTGRRGRRPWLPRPPRTRTRQRDLHAQSAPYGTPLAVPLHRAASSRARRPPVTAAHREAAHMFPHRTAVHRAHVPAAQERAVQSPVFKAMAGPFTRYRARTGTRCTRYRTASPGVVHRVVRRARGAGRNAVAPGVPARRASDAGGVGGRVRTGARWRAERSAGVLRGSARTSAASGAAVVARDVRSVRTGCRSGTRR